MEVGYKEECKERKTDGRAETHTHVKVDGHLFVYAFEWRSYPKQRTNEDVTMQLKSKLIMSYLKLRSLDLEN